MVNIIFVLLVLTEALSGGVGIGTPRNANPAIGNHREQECDLQSSAGSDTYVNRDVGFELHFRGKWTEYKMNSAPYQDGGNGCVFAFAPAGDELSEGFYLFALPRSPATYRYMNPTTKNGPYPIFLGESNDYEFGYELSQDLPISLTLSEILEVIHTFRIIAQS